MAKLDAPRGRMSGRRAAELAKDYLESAKLEKAVGSRKAAAQSLTEARRLLKYAKAYK